ncbi:MAG TPA: sigma-54 dependent transcriptional regulator [Spirochaetota bacterium]|nr:sigma-54 dependent transcriptional regulator [Spirochaetota bacterium]HOM38482.1 sigma-54 dependent transcriptional regulator [Spirochaetota bacterium]HPQ49022.1 sigma-54 dependent transcriptional regulator [Spirochaetota bacterium]
MKKILLVDDEKNFHYSFKRVFKDLDILSCYSPEEAEKILNKNKEDISIIILDIKMPGKSGLQFLEEIRKNKIDVPIIIITAHGDLETAVEAIKKGATEYLLKPFDFEELKNVIYSKIDSQKTENINKNDAIEKHIIIGKSAKIQEVYKKIAKIAEKDITVLITGESGVGKERVARAIHYYSRRKNMPFVAVNCGAIPENLLESELFGYTKGAFTGAYSDKKGKFLLANNGTLFLDEVGELPQHLQVKVLRAIQESEITPVGSEKTIKIDVRIIAATNKDLKEEIKKGNFREDLYYRLNVFPINIPPLRERKEDIKDIITFIIKRLNIEKNINVKGISDKALNKLLSYDFPGNIRELENIISHAAIISYDGYIDEDSIEINQEIEKSYQNIDKIIEQIFEIIFEKGLKIDQFLEKEVLKFLLKKMDNNQSKIAEYLEINRNTLRTKLKKHDLI